MLKLLEEIVGDLTYKDAYEFIKQHRTIVDKGLAIEALIINPDAYHILSEDLKHDSEVLIYLYPNSIFFCETDIDYKEMELAYGTKDYCHDYLFSNGKRCITNPQGILVDYMVYKQEGAKNNDNIELQLCESLVCPIDLDNPVFKDRDLSCFQGAYSEILHGLIDGGRQRPSDEYGHSFALQGPITIDRSLIRPLVDQTLSKLKHQK